MFGLPRLFSFLWSLDFYSLAYYIGRVDVLRARD